LDRGLDVFQNYEMNDAFTFANRLQQHRACKAFEVTFIKNELGSKSYLEIEDAASSVFDESNQST